MNQPRAAIFVDVQNIYYTCREQFQSQFNYQALWQCISDRYDICAAYAYAIDRGDPKQQGFQSALRNMGYEVKLKPFIQRRDGSAKGDWDVGITIDVLEQAPLVDQIILLSGDGDFALLMDKVKQAYGCQTCAYGVVGLTAKALIDSVDRFEQIDQPLLLKRK